ncbi:MAG: 50S ribosomal protein L10 [Candidatus Thorarchaeota archaeon]|nr:MAG: 50S ribosomal protein L10 [Candidatus Thorarchaeota archaeon]
MAASEHVVPQWKRDEVDHLISMIKKSKMVGLVDVGGVGAKQLQGIRDSLRGSAVLRMARNTLMIRAIENSKVKGIDDLSGHVIGPVALIFSDQDPFSLSKFLRENKTKAPAKGGQVAPNDIVVPAMNTGVAPGPFISELAALKIPARVKTGVIHITDDTVVAKTGEVISNALAQMLGRLGIEPMELQLKLVAVYTDGAVFTSDAFEVDLKGLLEEVVLGHQLAVNLSVNICYPTADTIAMIITRADLDAKTLAINVGFFVPEMVRQFLVKADSEALALAAVLSGRNPEAVSPEILARFRTPVAVAATAPAVSASKKKKPEKEEEKKEEGAPSIGSLFG